MKLIAYLLSFLLFTKFVISQKVAIIGKGAESALCSYFLHKTIPEIKIDIYNHKAEQVTIFTGTVFHSHNLYLSNIIEEKNAPVVNCAKSIIKDGDKFYHLDIEKLTGYNKSFYEALKKYATDELKIFNQIYNVQEKGQAFKSVRELLKSLAPHFENYYANETTESVLNMNPATHANLGITKYVQAGLASHFTDMNAHGFIGLALLMFSDITGETKKVAHASNKSFVKSLFDENDETIENDVWKIVRRNNKNYIVEKSGEQIAYDFVILATTTADQIKYEDFTDTVKVFKYQNISSTYLTGKLTNKFKNASSDLIPIIDIQKNRLYIQIPMRPATYYSIIGLKPPTHSEILEYLKPKSYKIKNKSPVVVHAPPDYSMKEDGSVQNAKFELGENLYNVQAMYSLGIVNEMIAIGAKNIALLIRDKIGEIGIFDERITSGERASSSSGVGKRTNRSRRRKPGTIRRS